MSNPEGIKINNIALPDKIRTLQAALKDNQEHLTKRFLSAGNW